MFEIGKMTPKPAIDANVVVFRGDFTVLNAAHVGIIGRQTRCHNELTIALRSFAHFFQYSRRLPISRSKPRSTGR